MTINGTRRIDTVSRSSNVPPPWRWLEQRQFGALPGRSRSSLWMDELGPPAVASSPRLS
jgi:hypothetical protein